MGFVEGTRVFAPGSDVQVGEKRDCQVIRATRQAIIVGTLASPFKDAPAHPCLYVQMGQMTCQVDLDWAIQISRYYESLSRNEWATVRTSLKPGKDLRELFLLKTPPSYPPFLVPVESARKSDTYAEWFETGKWNPQRFLEFGIPDHLVL
jgi:hypothetical protein